VRDDRDRVVRDELRAGAVQRKLRTGDVSWVRSSRCTGSAVVEGSRIATLATCPVWRRVSSARNCESKLVSWRILFATVVLAGLGAGAVAGVALRACEVQALADIR
jgi:hypothetical protein